MIEFIIYLQVKISKALCLLLQVFNIEIKDILNLPTNSRALHYFLFYDNMVVFIVLFT
jgi:hypothetical protein